MKLVVSITAVMLTGCNVVQVRVNPEPAPVSGPPVCGSPTCKHQIRPMTVHASKKGFYIGLSKGW